MIEDEWYIRGMLDGARCEVSRLEKKLKEICTHPKHCVDTTHEWNNSELFQVEVRYKSHYCHICEQRWNTDWEDWE